jgi:hypothetical protein
MESAEAVITLICIAVVWFGVEMQWRENERHALDHWWQSVNQARAEAWEDELRWS